MKKLTSCIFILLASTTFSQNVGINATGATPVTSAALDVDMVNKGILIPRVALTSSITFAPITGTATTSLLVYNTATAGVIPNNVVPGYYYWNGTKWTSFSGTGSNDWSITGNNGTVPSTNFLGTSDNQDLVIRTNNVETMRILSGGNVGIGTATPLDRLQVAGDVRVGLVNPINTGAFPNYGNFLNFSGGPSGATFNSENSDPVWIARYNLASDQTYLRFNIGDNIQAADAFQFGITSGISYTAVMHINAVGNIGIGTTTPLAKLDLSGLKTAATTGTGAANHGPSQALIPAGSNGASFYNDWPSGWFGGISTWDIVGASTFFNAYLTRSDRKLKKDILSIDNNINENFMKLRPVTYLMKSESPEIHGTQYGFIAQEVAELFPTLVTEDSGKEGAIIGMNYQGLIAPTIYMVQQLQTEIDLLREQNTLILKRLAELEKK